MIGVVAGIEMGDTDDRNIRAECGERSPELAVRIVAVPVIVAGNARIVLVLLFRLARIHPERGYTIPRRRIGPLLLEIGFDELHVSRGRAEAVRPCDRVARVPRRTLPGWQRHMIPLRTGIRRRAEAAPCGLDRIDAGHQRLDDNGGGAEPQARAGRLSCRFDEKRDRSGSAHGFNPLKADGLINRPSIRT